LWCEKNKDKKKEHYTRWRAANPIKVLESRLRCEYKFSEREIKKILAWKGSRCICGKVLTKLGRGWSDGHIEHNHKTGKFRGIICGRCNYVLGAVEENQRLLTNMKKHLKRGLR